MPFANAEDINVVDIVQAEFAFTSQSAATTEAVPTDDQQIIKDIFTKLSKAPQGHTHDTKNSKNCSVCFESHYQPLCLFWRVSCLLFVVMIGNQYAVSFECCILSMDT